jgi:hypothetical protein
MSLPYVDVFDESDHILRAKQQLIYAVGLMQCLPSFAARVDAAVVVLDILRSPEVASRWLTDGVAERTADRFKWLRAFSSDEAARDLLRRCLTDASLSFEDALDRLGHRVQDDGPFRDLLLALRGLLAFGIAFSCLKKRHNVEYGQPNAETANKRLAVPYRGADTPSLRSEFAQPDVAILLTLLSSYSIGLNEKQLREALECLLQPSVNDSEREQEYTEDPSLLPEDVARVDRPSKLDLSNAAQFALLMRMLSRHVLVVCYWLRRVVLCDDTATFPQRRSASPWDLVQAHARFQCGFSGTNDTTPVLPCRVEALMSRESALRATNAHMVNTLLSKPSVEVLPAPHRSVTAAIMPTKLPAIVDAVLKCAISRGDAALIDIGGLVAGVSGDAVADAVLGLLESGLWPPRERCRWEPKAVVYFCVREQAWMCRGKHMREWRLSNSPLSEHDALCFSMRADAGAQALSCAAMQWA